MPLAPIFPNVTIELPSGVGTISGVATSIAAFVGFFSRGPMNEAVPVVSAGDFERAFGGLRSDSEASYAIDQFFLNGGGKAWIVRAADGNEVAASVVLRNAADSVDSLTVEARSPGSWGDNLRLDVDYGTSDPAITFNLTVREVVDGAVVSSEAFRNLTLAAGPGNVRTVVDAGSKLIRIAAQGSAANADRPAATGTVSVPVTAAVLAAIDGSEMMTADVSGAHRVSGLGSAPASVEELTSALRRAIRAADASLSDVTVTAYGSLDDGTVLSVRAGTSNPAAGITLDGPLATELGFGDPNVQEYVLGGAAALRQRGSGPAAAALPGNDGGPPGAADLSTALAAFDSVDLLNILCLPDTVRLSDAEALSIIADATAYCEKRRAFYIVDVPQADIVRDGVTEMKAWIDHHGTLRHRNVALYFPRPRVADPLAALSLRAIAPGGTLAGIYARTDAERGVWKAPAGIDAQLHGVAGLERALTDDENGVLNRLGVNCLRSFPTIGCVCWGSRTLVGSDQLASEWKYVPVRRLALFLEQSLHHGTQWAVFEPNDETLWATIRLQVGAFMLELYHQGAFPGASRVPEAYFVKCDSETTTQDDIRRGIVNIVVGFAPLRPAEFVILKIQQQAGQL